MSSRYYKSESYLNRALQTIPLASQTFSKSLTQFPHGVSPFFIDKGKGSKVWDIDGNEYIDFINGLASITLGHCNDRITKTVEKQLHKGSIHSLPDRLEAEVAEKIVSMVPCAEMVRFGKNGSDATSGAIRLARAYTDREYIAVCGYHGWQDWYIGSTTRNKGVPKAVQDLTLKFNYNDPTSLQKLFDEHCNEIAAVIIEPMNVEYPIDNFLEIVKKITHKNNAILIFDETITGFRFSKGGAQELFGVTPDIATFGKGLANGFPLSAIAGNKEIMKEMENIFYSFTFGGETLSLAASLETLDIINTEPVLEIINTNGEAIIKGLNKMITEFSADKILEVKGHPSWSFLIAKDTENYSQWEIKTYMMQELFARGILTYGTHNMSCAHTGNDISILLEKYTEVIGSLIKNLKSDSLNDVIQCNVIEPLFKVR